MKIFGLHILALNGSQAAIAKAALKDAGHELADWGEAELAHLKAAVAAKYPDLVDAFHKGFDIVEHDDSVHGFAKMEKVVASIIPDLPEIAAEVADMPANMSFLLSLGQDLFTAARTELGKVAAGLIAKIVG